MSVELISHWGNDLNAVNVARTSYGKKVDKFTDKDAKLIKYLVDHKHTSVFRHQSLQFRITCPIYVSNQLQKHQVGVSVNSISGRYVDFSDTYHEIQQFRKQSTDSKQGSAEDLDPVTNALAIRLQTNAIEHARATYQTLLQLGVAKEQARSVLGLNLNTTFIWTGTFLAFIHMCNLRLKQDAQLETQLVVREMLGQVKNIKDNPFQHSLAAFRY